MNVRTFGCTQLAYHPKDSTNQCFFCEQQAMASGYVHLSMLPLLFTIYFFDIFRVNCPRTDKQISVL